MRLVLWLVFVLLTLVGSTLISGHRGGTLHLRLVRALPLLLAPPDLVKLALELNAKVAHGVAYGVEQKTVFDHEVKIFADLDRLAVLALLKFLRHGAEVHGMLDDLAIMRDVQSNRINGQQEDVVHSGILRATDQVESVLAEPELKQMLTTLWLGVSDFTVRRLDGASWPLNLRVPANLWHAVRLERESLAVVRSLLGRRGRRRCLCRTCVATSSRLLCRRRRELFDLLRKSLAGTGHLCHEVVGVSQHVITSVGYSVLRSVKLFGVVYYQLKVIGKSLDGGVPVVLKLVLHRAQVHRMLDHIWVRGDVQRNRIDWRGEIHRMLCLLRVLQFLQEEGFLRVGHRYGAVLWFPSSGFG